MADILKKFDFAIVKTTSTPMEPNKALIKDEEADSVDVHLYRSMIGSLMYLTASRPDIMFAVCACARFQVTPKMSHLHDVKRIFRYLKASLDRKSTTRGCQFLSKRLISWQCKKETIVANSTTEAEYVAAANCCDAKSLWVAIKSRFGGNDESKKMHRNVLKHQFENFTTAPNESLDKAYDSQIALIMRNKPDIDQTDIDDLYNNLRVYEDEMKRSSSSTSNSQNLAFLSSENTSSTNEVSSTPGTDEVVCSFFAQQTTSPPLDNEDLQQIDQDDLEELDIRWQVAMLTVRVQRFIKKTGRNLDFKGKQPDGIKGKDLMVIMAGGMQQQMNHHHKHYKTNEVNIEKRKSVHESVVSKSVINRDKVIIEDWNSDDEDDVSEINIDPVSVDSGCSSHMTSNKAYLLELSDIMRHLWPCMEGNPKEMNSILTFSLSHKCDKKNSVLFTDTECLILSPSFKLLDENQVVLRAPRQNGVYSLDLKNIVPSGEFKNHAMNEFCAKKGIKREFSMAKNYHSKMVHQEVIKKLLRSNICFHYSSELRISAEYVNEKEEEHNLSEAEQALKDDLEKLVTQEMVAKAIDDATR
ncbi:hypothetical protein Tco_1165241 [Tanacetum coccineum]